MLCLFFFHYRILRIIVVVVVVDVSSSSLSSSYSSYSTCAQCERFNAIDSSTTSLSSQTTALRFGRENARYSDTRIQYTRTHRVHTPQCTLHGTRAYELLYIFLYFVIMRLDRGQPHQTETRRMRIECARRLTCLFESSDKNEKIVSLILVA